MKKNIIEAPPDGVGGPRWIVKLNTGTYIVGRPSWLSSGPTVALPYPEATDWLRLQRRLEENHNEKIVSLTLYVPPYGKFEAPKNLGGYGYFEGLVVAQRTRQSIRSGVESLSICYPIGNGKIEIIKVYAKGMLEKRVRTSWLPCMIGDQQADSAVKDEGIKEDEAKA